MLVNQCLKIPEEKRLLFKPKLDDRFEEEYAVAEGTHIRYVTTHAGQVMNAYAISSCDEIESYLKPKPFRSYSSITHIFIDEAQFLPSLVASVRKLLQRGLHVMVAGLDLTYQRQPFGEVMDLTKYADQWIRLKARCDAKDHDVSSGLKAEYTFRTTSDVREVAIGGKEMYLPVCETCYLQMQMHR